MCPSVSQTLPQVSNVTQSFSFAVELDVPVQGLKPAVVKVYDYYVTGEDPGHFGAGSSVGGPGWGGHQPPTAWPP